MIVLTGAGDKFFCIGGRKDGMEDTTLYAGTLPTLEMYEAIEKLQKPVIASVNGFAVGGGNVLQMVCDCTIAKESAVFRQVGPMMGSFDAGYGTWYLEDLVGKKRAKEIWFRNPKITAREALAMGLINKVVPDAELQGRHARVRARDRRARRLRAGLRQGRLQRAPRRRRRACRAWRTTCCCAATSKATRARSCRKAFAEQAQARPVQVRQVAGTVQIRAPVPDPAPSGSGPALLRRRASGGRIRSTR